MWRLRCRTFLIGFLALQLLRVQSDEDIGLCCLCEYCNFPASGRDNFAVDELGTTCYEVLLDMADFENDSTPGSSACTNLQNKHRQTCCDASYNPPEVAIAPTPAPVINLPYGDEPLCDVCPGGGFPSNPTTVLAILYIPGNPTCEILYEMGKRGLIEQRLCNPIQDYLFEACGCNQGQLGLAPVLVLDPPTAAPSPSPTPAPTHKPTLAPVSPPTPTPTKKPSPAPASAPTPAPTHKPTLAPEAAPTLSPTFAPTLSPTPVPTPAPTSGPSLAPTLGPTPPPTLGPTKGPTSPPTLRPTKGPTSPPTLGPTPPLTLGPTKGPTSPPTLGPTKGPTSPPTPGPTSLPTVPPTQGPTRTMAPTPAPVVAQRREPPSSTVSKNIGRYVLNDIIGRTRGGSRRQLKGSEAYHSDWP